MVRRMLVVMMAGLFLLCGISIAEMKEDHAIKIDSVKIQTQQPSDEAPVDDGAHDEDQSENQEG